MREQSYYKNNSRQNNIKGGETKIMKKVLMIFLAIALVFTMSAPVFAATPTSPLPDKFAELKAAGILDGDANGNMLPLDSTMTRQQLAKVACTLNGVAGTPGVNIPAYAKDYKLNVWGFDQGWIQAAYTNKLMIGKGAAGFDSQGKVSVAELLTVVLRSMGLKSELEASNKVWYTAAMDLAVEKGLIQAGAVEANADATYGALVMQVWNAYNYNQSQKDLTVVSVTSANGKEAKIVFNKAVEASTVITGTVLQNVTITPVGSAPAVTVASADAKLSADGKTVTIVPSGTEVFNGKYVFTATNLIKEKGAPTKALTPYSAIADLTDNVRPAIASVTNPKDKHLKVTFTEPITATAADFAAAFQAKHNVSLGVKTLVAGDFAVAADQSSVVIDITSVGVNPNMPGNYVATLVGLRDYAGNMINPNPATFNILSDEADDTVKPSLVNIEALGVGAAKITFSEKMDTAMNITIDGGAAIPLVIGTNATFDSTGTIVTTNGILGLTGTVKVAVTGAKDLAGNAINTGSFGTPVNYKFVTFVPDNTAPKYVSNSIETISGINYLLVKFDENVTWNAGQPAGTYIDANSITHTVTIAGAVTQHVVAPATKSDTVKIVLTGEIAGTYNVVLPAGFVKDVSTNTNPSLQANISFTLGAQLDPAVPVATIGTVQATEDTVIVTFDKDVTAATALNVANYKVDGNNVFTSAIFMGDAKTVHLKLAPGAITINGSYQMQVANVATAAGKVMLPKAEVKVFKDNVKPTFTKAALATTTTITATFSKALATGSDSAFEVYKDGTKIAATHTFAAGTTATITIPEVDLGATYTVKFVGTDLKDANLNTTISGNTVTMTK